MSDYRDELEARAGRGMPRGANTVFNPDAPSTLASPSKALGDHLLRPVALLVVGVILTGAAFLVTTRDDSDEGVVLSQSHDPYFADVTESSPFFEDIQWLGIQGISEGSEQSAGKPLFKPTGSLERQAMAAFLYRIAGSPDIASDEPYFADVGADHEFFDAIQWMGETGLSTGTPQSGGKPLFEPYVLLTREAMAAFMYRAAGSPPVPGDSSFSDVSPADPFAGEIAWLGSTKISTGRAGTGTSADPVFGPGTTLTRQAAAAFLHRYDDFVRLTGCVNRSIPDEDEC